MIVRSPIPPTTDDSQAYLTFAVHSAPEFESYAPYFFQVATELLGNAHDPVITSVPVSPHTSHVQLRGSQRNVSIFHKRLFAEIGSHSFSFTLEVAPDGLQGHLGARWYGLNAHLETLVKNVDYKICRRPDTERKLSSIHLVFNRMSHYNLLRDGLIHDRAPTIPSGRRGKPTFSNSCVLDPDLRC